MKPSRSRNSSLTRPWTTSWKAARRATCWAASGLVSARGKGPSSTLQTNPTRPLRPFSTNWSSAWPRRRPRSWHSSRLPARYWGSWTQHAKLASTGHEGFAEGPNLSATRSNSTKTAGAALVVWLGCVVVGTFGLACAQIHCPGVTAVLVEGDQAGFTRSKSRATRMFCSRCGACQQSLPRCLLRQCTSSFERQASTREASYSVGGPRQCSLASQPPFSRSARARMVRAVLRCCWYGGWCARPPP